MVKRIQPGKYLGKECPGRGDDSGKGLEVGAALMCPRPAWQGGQDARDSVTKVRMLGDVSKGRPTGARAGKVFEATAKVLDFILSDGKPLEGLKQGSHWSCLCFNKIDPHNRKHISQMAEKKPLEGNLLPKKL